MKCANEINKLIECGMTAIADYTRQWCELVLAPMLEENASKHHIHKCVVWFDGTQNSTVVHHLKEKPHSDYSDNRLCADIISQEIDLNVLRDYLKQFCYTINVLTGNYTYARLPYWKYGYGMYKATLWEVKPAPKCK